MEFPASARRRIACLAAQFTFVPDAGTATVSQQVKAGLEHATKPAVIIVVLSCDHFAGVRSKYEA